MSKTFKGIPAYMYDKTIYQNKEKGSEPRIQHSDFLFLRVMEKEADREKGEERSTEDDGSLQIMFQFLIGWFVIGCSAPLFCHLFRLNIKLQHCY